MQWSASKLRYFDPKKGRWLTERHIREKLTLSINETVLNVLRITQRYLSGEIDEDTWEEEIRHEIKMAHITSALLGRGGREQATPSFWGRVGGRLGFQYRKLAGFRAQLPNLSESQILARAMMYAESAYTAYEDGRTEAARVAGFLYERRVLTPGAEHCEDCVRYAELGTQPLGSLPEPGVGSRCLTRCRCRKQRSRDGEAWV